VIRLRVGLYQVRPILYLNPKLIRFETDLNRTRQDLISIRPERIWWAKTVVEVGGKGRGSARQLARSKTMTRLWWIECDVGDGSDEATRTRSRRPEIPILLDRAVVGCRQRKGKEIGGDD